MVTIPTGSIFGIALLSMVVGIVIGRSGRAMRGLGRLHAAAHGGTAKGGDATATGGTGGGARVQTVVVVGRDGAPLSDGAAGWAEVVDLHRAGGVGESAAARGELVEADPDPLTRPYRLFNEAES
jgi:hypothetical protein